MNPGLALIQRIQAMRTATVASVMPTPNVAEIMEKNADRERPPSEADRIEVLPAWDPDTFKIDLTEDFKTSGGSMVLNPIQSLALHWMRQQGGLLGPLAVGVGKTLVSLLAPVAMGAQRPMLLIPPQMQIPLRRQIEKFRPHWNLPLVGPRHLSIVPYSQLSQAKNTDLFDRLRPDVIISDECHLLRHPESARTKRLIRYAQAYPETRFVFLSGTFTSRSLRDYAHLAELALRAGSPLPRDEQFLIAWANCIDAKAIGTSKDWDLFAQWRDFRDIDDEGQRRGEAREAFRKRLVTTPGVVATVEGSIECSLSFIERSLDVPDVIQDALDELRETWTRPDGEELVTGLDVWRVGMQLAQGFYYRWDWPEGKVDWEWMIARSAWHKSVREFLKQSLVGLDSPFLVTRAVMVYIEKTESAPTDVPDEEAEKQPARWEEIEEHPELVDAWKQWDKVRHRPRPPVSTVWLDASLIEDVLAWREQHPKGLIWYSDTAVEAALRVCGLTVYGAGEVPPEDGSQGGLCLSVRSHGTGLNMQVAHHENLVISWQGGSVMEQLIGRTHRQGQVEDEVLVWYYNHTAEVQETLVKSIEDARYQFQTTGSPQKLVYASWI